MNLQTLMETHGGAVKAGEVLADVTWKDPHGDTVDFKVIIKVDTSAADYEFIAMGSRDPKSIDHAFMARRVHRLVKFPATSKDEKPQSIPLEVAGAMRPDLLLQICKAVNRVQGKEETPEEAEKN